MHIVITYPADFPLPGWARETFNKRILSAFDNSWFNVCDLDACRSVLGLEKSEANASLHTELSAWHCTDFKDMPDIVRAELPTKVAEYLGEKVSIRIDERSAFARGWNWVARPRILIPLCLLTTFAVASCAALLFLPAKKIPGYQLGTVLPAPTLHPLEAPDTQRASVRDDPMPILETQVTTQSPRATLHGLSTALIEIPEAPAYDVRVIVTPLPPHKLPDVAMPPPVDSSRNLLAPAFPRG